MTGAVIRFMLVNLPIPRSIVFGLLALNAVMKLVLRFPLDSTDIAKSLHLWFISVRMSACVLDLMLNCTPGGESFWKQAHPTGSVIKSLQPDLYFLSKQSSKTFRRPGSTLESAGEAVQKTVVSLFPYVHFLRESNNAGFGLKAGHYWIVKIIITCYVILVSWSELLFKS